MIRESNSDNLDGKAINYMGIKGNSYTYKEIFEMTSMLAHAYKKAGVQKGDTVLIATVSGLEEVLNLLALNQIGAISKWIDVTASEEDLKEAIVDDNCKFMVCFAIVIPKVEKIINETNLETVLYVEPSQFIKKSCYFAGAESIRTLNELKKQGKENPLPKKPEREKYIRFIDFMRKGDKKYIESVPYCKDTPAIKIQSSGTTGKPKVIVHSDFTINSAIYKHTGIDLPFYKGNVLLKIAPSWVGYGLINSLALPMAMEMEVLITPSFDADLLIKMNGKYDMVLGVPFLYRYLAEHIDEIEDMSRVKAFISGGDKISKTEIENIQKMLKTKNCSVPILNGAGCNEIVGSGCVNPLLANRPGSIGIPIYGDEVGIFDVNTLEEKNIGERGEICYKTDSAFLYYENNTEQTNSVKVTHPDGSVWIHTKDLGYMDFEGYFYIEGRLTRVITVGGFKISANTIEEALETCEMVKECVAVAVPDAEWGEVPMLYIVLAEDYIEQEAMEKIKLLCQERIKGRALPKYYRCIKEIPYTSNNKYDFKKLERMGKEWIEN